VTPGYFRGATANRDIAHGGAELRCIDEETLMLSRRTLMGAGAGGLVVALSGRLLTSGADAAETFEVTRSEAEWRKQLTADQFAVLRRSGTERPFTSPLLHEERKGTFACVGCDLDLFASETKFDSRTGWPSFWAPIENAVGTSEDKSFGMTRTAVHCHRCGGHLGHVFKDGPRPTGLRYCMNGVAMTFKTAAA
jgi:peptide-methionine (R)-S-oxide reductase